VARAAFTATLGRPDYPDMAPVGAFDRREAVGIPNVFTGTLSEGNPSLKPYESRNFDLSLAYYFPNRTGYVSIGGFRKEIDNAIYPFTYDAVRDTIPKTGFDYTRLPNGYIQYLGHTYEQLTVNTFNNAQRGKVTGLELTYQHDLSFLPAPLNGFGFSANAALIDSSVRIFQRPTETFPFFRQADKIYNFQLYYQRRGFEARLGWHYQSPAFLQPGPDAFRDLYEGENAQLDARVSYQFTRWLEAYVSAKNIGDEPSRNYWNRQALLGFGPGEAGGGYRVHGATYHVGVKWSFDRP
jgi:TonB-dependent receptor